MQETQQFKEVNSFCLKICAMLCVIAGALTFWLMPVIDILNQSLKLTPDVAFFGISWMVATAPLVYWYIHGLVKCFEFDC